MAGDLPIKKRFHFGNVGREDLYIVIDVATASKIPIVLGSYNSLTILSYSRILLLARDIIMAQCCQIQSIT